jgi:hypothetical protein
MAYRTGKYWSVKWDDITLQQSGKYIEADDQLYSDIDAVYKRFWKLKSRPVWMGVGLGRIIRLSQEEAVEAAGLISQALNRCIHDKGE